MDEIESLELRSFIASEGELRLSLEPVTHSPPGPDEVIVRVEATPINPSDIGLLCGPADLATMKEAGTVERPILTMRVPRERLVSVRGRLDQSLPIGNEGAGTVVAAGSAVSNLLGKRVGMYG